MLVLKQIAVLLVVVSITVPGCTSRTASPKPDESQEVVEPLEVPADFKIDARYAPGFSPSPGWATTIRADGNVSQTIHAGRGGGQGSINQSQLTKTDIDALWIKVMQAHFFQLKREYKAAITDNATLALEITRNKETHRVSVYGHQHIQVNRSEVDRFLSLWSEVIKLVLPPKPD